MKRTTTEQVFSSASTAQPQSWRPLGSICVETVEGVVVGVLEMPDDGCDAPTESRLARRHRLVIDRLRGERDQARRDTRLQACATAVAAIDLRQSLSAVSAVLQRQGQRVDGPADLAWHETGVEEVMRLQRGLDEMLCVSQRSLAGEATLRWVALAPILARLDEKWRFQAAARGVAFRVARGHGRVWSVPTLVAGMLDSLVEEAMERRGAGAVSVSLRMSGGRCRLEVKGSALARSRQRCAKQQQWTQDLAPGIDLVRAIAKQLDHRLAVRSGPGALWRGAIQLSVADH